MDEIQCYRCQGEIIGGLLISRDTIFTGRISMESSYSETKKFDLCDTCQHKLNKIVDTFMGVRNED